MFKVRYTEGARIGSYCKGFENFSAAKKHAEEKAQATHIRFAGAAFVVYHENDYDNEPYECYRAVVGGRG